jgi:hypothetical protein
MAPYNYDKISFIEEIVMIGYPIGFWDEKHNLPLSRRGITSTHPNIDFKGKPMFLIDAACLPGSSGSPIFLANFNWSRKEGGDIVIGSKILFLGVLFATPELTKNGNLKMVPVPTSGKPITLADIPNNLGIAIHSKKLKDFEPIIKEQNYEKYGWEPDWLKNL